MQLHQARPIVALLCTTGLLTGCAASGSEDQKQSGTLSWTVEKYSDQASAAADDVQDTLAAHKALLGFDQGEFGKPYKEFAKGVERCAKNQQGLTKTSTEMMTQAEDRFAAWEARIEAFSSESMADLSRDHMNSTRGKYEAVSKAAVSAMEVYDPLLSLLQDHVLFLSTDLTRSAIAALADDGGKLDAMQMDLREKLGELSTAADTFVEATAMSVAPPPEEAEPAEEAKVR